MIDKRLRKDILALRQKARMAAALIKICKKTPIIALIDECNKLQKNYDILLEEHKKFVEYMEKNRKVETDKLMRIEKLALKHCKPYGYNVELLEEILSICREKEQ